MSLAIKRARANGGRGGLAYGPMYYGDPGLFGKIASGFKSIGKAVGGAVIGGVKGFVKTGSPFGGVKGAVSGAVRSFTSTTRGPGVTPAQLPVPPSWPGGPAVDPFGRGGQVDIFSPPPGAYGGQDVGQAIVDVTSAVACPAGFRPNKSAYYQRTPGGIVFHPKGTKCVRSRRRNPLNPRALSRSMSRVAGARKAIRRLITTSTQVTPKGKMIFKKKAKTC